MANKKDNRLFQKTEHAIKEAYLELLNEKSVDKISITEICNRAQVSRPAFYAHFQTKEDIILEYVDQFLTVIFQEFDAIEICLNSPDTARLIRLFFQTWQENAEMYDLLKKTNLFDHVKNSYLEKQYIQILKRLKKKYQNVNEINFKYIITNALGGYFSVLDLWMAEGMILPVEEVVSLLMEIRKQPISEEKLSELISSTKK